VGRAGIAPGVDCVEKSGGSSDNEGMSAHPSHRPPCRPRLPQLFSNRGLRFQYKDILPTSFRAIIRLVNDMTGSDTTCHVLNLISVITTSLGEQVRTFVDDIINYIRALWLDSQEKKIDFSILPLPSLPHSTFFNGPMWQRYACWLVEMVELIIKPALGMVQW